MTDRNLHKYTWPRLLANWKCSTWSNLVMFLNMYQCQKAFENLSCYRSPVFNNKEICNRFDVEFINFHTKKGMVGWDIDCILENIPNKFVLII